MKRLRLVHLAVLMVTMFLGLTFVTKLQAQSKSITASLSGTVTDPTGARIPKAAVKLTNPESGTTRSDTTSALGEFNFAFLPTGTYVLEASAPGFKTVVRNDLPILVNQTAREDFQLLMKQVEGVVKTPYVLNIETQQAIDNIGAILDTPGISGIYIGPSDLGFSLGLVPILDREEPQILGIYEMLLRETGKRGLFAGLHNATAAYAARMIGMGFRFVTIANDSGLMARAAREAVNATRKAAGEVAN